MRQAFATQLAVVTGVLIVILAVIFALIQTPSIAENALIAAAPLIPHPLDGYEDCVSCHGRNEDVPYPANHLGWPNTSCTQCHIPAEAVAVATAVAVPIEAATDADEQDAGEQAPAEDAQEGETGAEAEPPAVAETPDEQVANGEAVYTTHCAQCHDPGGTEAVLDASTLAAYGTARELFEYTRSTMPPAAPGSLSDQQYWDVVAYLLAAEALLPADTMVGPESGDEIQINQS
jgi:mono/diheme cytochrome c family protein